MDDFEVRELEVSMIKPARTEQGQYKKLPFTTFDVMQKRSSMPFLQRVCFFPSSMDADSTESLIQNMKNSLSEVLVHFYPLAGRLSVPSEGARPELDCNGAGVEFSVAAADVALAELDYSHPQLWYSKLIRRGNYEHAGLSTDIPFYTIQVTKFRCGSICIAWASDHLVVDGASLWHFMCSWAEIARGQPISLLPIHDRFWEQQHEMFAGVVPTSSFSYTFEDVSLGMEARIIDFDGEAIAKLKSAAGGPFTAFEVVASQVWIALCRARELPASQAVSHQLPLNCRSRLQPPIPQSYFGNCVLCAIAESTVGELIAGGLPVTARIVHDTIVTFQTDQIRSRIVDFNSNTANNPFSAGVTDGVDTYTGSSHRFPMYKLDFGWGKPAAVRHARFLWSGFCFYDPRPKEGSGMEVTVFLPHDQMEKFTRLVYDEETSTPTAFQKSEQ